MSAAYFGYPAEKLKVIGITGTKGKTTTTYMVKSILEGVGHKVGLIGTIEQLSGISHPGEQYDAGVLYDPSVFCADGGSRMRQRGYGSSSRPDASQDSRHPV